MTSRLMTGFHWTGIALQSEVGTREEEMTADTSAAPKLVATIVAPTKDVAAEIRRTRTRTRKIIVLNRIQIQIGTGRTRVLTIRHKLRHSDSWPRLWIVLRRWKIRRRKRFVQYKNKEETNSGSLPWKSQSALPDHNSIFMESVCPSTKGGCMSYPHCYQFSRKHESFPNVWTQLPWDGAITTY